MTLDEWAQSLRPRLQSLSTGPFARLVHHCINRIFYGSEGAIREFGFGVGTLLAVLAMPGAFVTVALSSKYGSLFLWLGGNRRFDPYVASLPDEYFFIVLSMVVSGSTALWKWDALLPDRRDYANLAHLPIRTSSIFLANLVALLLLGGAFSVDINAASSILFPLFACASNNSFGYTAVFFTSHLVSVILAAAFGFLAVLSVLGILMTILPYRTFRKSSVYVRCALLVSFAALLMSAFSEPDKIQDPLRAARSWSAFPPPAWFLGLCQSLRGIHSPLLSSLSAAAILMTFSVLALAIGAYGLSYRRCFARSAETMAGRPAGGGGGIALGFRLLDGTVLRTPFQRAGYRFVMRTLFRSEAHALTWIGFTGVGVIIVAQTLFASTAQNTRITVTLPSAGILGAPLILSYFLILGLRFAFEIPAPIRANWLFRLGVDSATHQCASLARRVIVTFEAPLLVACFSAYRYFWGWHLALIHTGVVAVVAQLIAETLLLRFRKIPFTCSSPPFRSTAGVAVLIYVLGFLVLARPIPFLERQALDGLFLFGPLLTVVLLFWSACLYQSKRSTIEIDRRIIFEDTNTPAVQVLDLTFHR